MLTIGDSIPEFDLPAVSSADPETAFGRVSRASLQGKWTVLFFWPKDFTFVCPTEIVSFGEMADGFAERDARLLGASIDSEFVHLAWRQSNAALKDSPFPWLSDLKRDLAGALGILDREEGVALRATFIADPDGVIRFASVNDHNVGRSAREILRVLDALQTGELCPADWRKGDATLDAA